MKIRHPVLIRMLSLIGASALWAWTSTLRYRARFADPDADPDLPGRTQRFIYVFWHEIMLMPVAFYCKPNFRMLVSRHADGELITQVVEHLGVNTIRGSTTRGGIQAMREMLRQAPHADIAITPDGPRGPRRHVHKGVIYLASRTGIPIVPAGMAFKNAWRARSWDRFVLPKPFSPGALYCEAPIPVPRGLDARQLEAYRQQTETALLRATARAEVMARRM